MRRRLVWLATVPLFWPLEFLADMGYVPSLGFIRVHLALVQAVTFILDALLWINRDTGCRGRRP